MRRRRLGSHGPEMSVIGFGAWEAGGGSEWGTAPPEEQTLKAITAVFDCGIDWIDTAEVYGDGRSEELVARAVGGRRDEILILSKVAPVSEGSGFRPEQVRSACERSLRRLRTDRIDLYQLHWPDETGVPLEDTWGAMASLADDGLVRHIGVSNFDRPLIERCEAIRHVDSLQQEFSMLQQRDRELIGWCGDQGIGVLSYGPLAFGLLTGAITAETVFAEGDFRTDGESDALFGSGFETSLASVERLRPIAERLGISLAQLALAWNVHQPGVTVAIAGSRNPEHVRSNAAAGDLELDDATRSELDAVVSQAAPG
ncbi:MAG TPA: aldo/keto reductase [Actinomycetota bacterium]|nr:aldo/keto reductase [Actinomycetota bacterium]